MTSVLEFADVSQKGVDFIKKSVKKINIFDLTFTDVHTARSSKIGHHLKKKRGSKIEFFKKCQSQKAYICESQIKKIPSWITSSNL